MTKIGICDWGIGGLGVYNGIRDELHSAVDIVYFSDSGYTPYGKVSSEELTKRWFQVESFLKDQGVDKIIVACNALSTVVDPSENVITISSVVKDLVREQKDEKVAVIGGQRTIESGVYDFGFDKHVGRIAQPLSALVEKGILGGQELEDEIEKVLGASRNVDKVVLACTHYPALIPTMKKLYPKIKFIDPCSDLIRNLKLPEKGNNAILSFTTGDVDQMIDSARKAWGIELANVQKVAF